MCFPLLLVPQLTQNNWKRSTRTWRSRQWLVVRQCHSRSRRKKKLLFPAKCDKVLFPPISFISAQCLFANLISSSFVCRRKSGKLFPIRRRAKKQLQVEIQDASLRWCINLRVRQLFSCKIRAMEFSHLVVVVACFCWFFLEGLCK